MRARSAEKKSSFKKSNFCGVPYEVGLVLQDSSLPKKHVFPNELWTMKTPCVNHGMREADRGTHGAAAGVGAGAGAGGGGGSARAVLREIRGTRVATHTSR